MNLGVARGEQTYNIVGTDVRFSASSVAEGLSIGLGVYRDPARACSKLAAELQAYGENMQAMLADYLKELIKGLVQGGPGIDVGSIRECAKRIDQGGDVGVCDDAVENLVKQGGEVFGESGFSVSGSIEVVTGTFINVAFDKIFDMIVETITKNFGLVDRVMGKLLKKINCAPGDASAPEPETADRAEELVEPAEPAPQQPAPAPSPSRPRPSPTTPRSQTQQPFAPPPPVVSKKTSVVPWVAAAGVVTVASYLILRYR